MFTFVTLPSKKCLSEPRALFSVSRSSSVTGISCAAIQSVEASDALRILERESQMRSVSLTGVQRQTNPQYRDAIQTLRQSPEQGFEKLERLGAVREVPGDRLLLTGNRRDADFRATNGELVKVRNVDSGRIQLEDGRALPVNYRQFDHGYAITSHRSQGKTVDGVILSADAMKQELFYVAASRGRSEIAIVTSDREQLRESLGISSARSSAIELAREQTLPKSPDHSIQQAPSKSIEALVPRHDFPLDHGLGLGL
ncbi:MAG: AAA family ATPase [Terracidiphilus sp.]